MIIHELHSAPCSRTVQALQRFEQQFTYPLGPGRSFRIDHGTDYPRFFRAMGEGACFVAERAGRTLGIIGAALRRLALPCGASRSVAYFGDVKIDPSARGGAALFRLAEAARQWVGARADAAFAVVMDGTSATPPSYTGRLQIPLFCELGKIMVLRLPTSGKQSQSVTDWRVTATSGAACFMRLSQGCFASAGGKPTERSAMDPIWLVEPDGQACGRLEDTRKAKRLFANDGHEMRSAHLSCFACGDVSAGVKLLKAALGHAARQNFPDLFVSVSATQAQAFCRALRKTTVVVAPATVFGTGLQPGPHWNINTAEI